MIVSFLLRLCGVCFHDHSRWEHEGSNLILVCSDCGRPVPALKRSEREAAQVRSGPEAGQLQAQRAPKSQAQSANVTPMRRKG